MITVCVSEVFPEVYEAEDHNIGIWIIGGVLLQMILESLTKGFEHGHFHHHTKKKKIFAYCFDGRNVCSCVLEGIPLANITDVTSPYLLGIVFHNLPISFILGTFLLRKKTIFFLVYHCLICISITIRNGFWRLF